MKFPNLFLIEAAIAMKACSTLVAFFALVSMKGMPISSAKAYEKVNYQLRYTAALNKIKGILQRTIQVITNDEVYTHRSIGD